MSFKDYILNVHPDPDFLGIKTVYDAYDELDRLAQNYAKDQNERLTKEVERLNTCVKTYSDMSLRAQEQILEMEKQIGNWKVLSGLNSKESIEKGLEIVRLTKKVEEYKAVNHKLESDLAKANLSQINQREELLRRIKRIPDHLD